MATHSSILAWRIPWTKEPGRQQSMGSQSQTWLRTFTFWPQNIRKPYNSVLKFPFFFSFTYFLGDSTTILVLNTCCCLTAKLCPTLCYPMDCSPQAPLSKGFSRQEYWSGSSLLVAWTLKSIQVSSLHLPPELKKYFFRLPTGQLHWNADCYVNRTWPRNNSFDFPKCSYSKVLYFSENHVTYTMSFRNKT